jgi:hypothetical protein
MPLNLARTTLIKYQVIKSRFGCTFMISSAAHQVSLCWRMLGLYPACCNISLTVRRSFTRLDLIYVLFSFHFRLKIYLIQQITVKAKVILHLPMTADVNISTCNV